MIDPRVASGLRDLPPSASIPRERMLDSFRKTFALFGFLPIETPHIERMEVLTGKGAGSEEVLRQIFEVNNKGGKLGELALRFDLTVPLARFIAKQGIPESDQNAIAYLYLLIPVGRWVPYAAIVDRPPWLSEADAENAVVEIFRRLLA